MAKIIKRTKKDGTCSYCIRVSNGYDRQGRQVLVNRTFTPPPGLTGKKLEKELQRQADAFEQEVHSGISLDASMKLDDLIERWFTEYADRQLKPKTATEYRKLVPRVSAALGHMKVNQIRPAHLMAFYANLSEGGVRQDSTYTATAVLLKLLPKGQRTRIRGAAGVGEETMRGLCSGKPVSRKTAEKVADAAGLPLSKAFTEKVRAGGKLGGNTQLHYHRFLSSVSEKAVKWQLIDENPCRRTEAPKAAEIEVEALQEEDVAKLLEALQDAPAQYSVITQLALLTGARRGEICALRWSDIDLDAGVISINRTVQNIAGRGTVFTAPKTKRSRRCIKIGPECVQLLREYRQHQKAERFKAGSEWVRWVEIENGKTVDNDLLFTRWNGQPFDPNAVTSWFPGFLAAHDLPAVHFHSLRHTNASLLIAAHVPVTTVSGRLGHAKTSTTTDIYAGFIRSSDAVAADALTDVFSCIKEKDPRITKDGSQGCFCRPREPSTFLPSSRCPFYGIMCPLESALLNRKEVKRPCTNKHKNDDKST